MGRIDRVLAGDYSHLLRDSQSRLAEFAAKRKAGAGGKKKDPTCNTGNYQCRGSKGVACIPKSKGCRADLKNKKVSPERQKYIDAAIAGLKAEGAKPKTARIGRKLGAPIVELTPEQYGQALALNISQLKLVRGDATREQLKAIGVDVDGLTAKAQPKKQQKNDPPAPPVGLNWPSPPAISNKTRDDAIAFLDDAISSKKRRGFSTPEEEQFYEQVIAGAKSGDPGMAALSVAMQWIGTGSIGQSIKMVSAMQKYSPEIKTISGVITNAYTSTAFTQVNGMLRQTSPYRWGEEEQAMAWAMKSALSEMPRTPPGTTLYRGVKLFDPYDDYAEEGAPTTSDYGVGEVIAERGVASTSRSRRQAEGFASGYGTTPGLFIIKQKEGGAGADISSVSDQSQEQEVAFPPRTEFVVRKRTMVDGVLEIELEEL